MVEFVAEKGPTLFSTKFFTVDCWCLAHKDTKWKAKWKCQNEFADIWHKLTKWATRRATRRASVT